MQTIREKNRAKIEELQPDKQWAAVAWEEECWEGGYPIEILQAYRSQEQQDALWKQGRTTKGQIITWTLQSKHTDRLAVDVRPCGVAATTSFYKKIKALASKYGITFPLQGKPYYDMGHAEFTNVSPKPAEPSKEAKFAALMRLAKRLATNTPKVADRLLKRINAKLK